MAEIYTKGQVVIPKYIRDMFNLHPGSQVHFSVENNRIYIDSVEEAIAEMELLRSKGVKGGSFASIQRDIKRIERKRIRKWINDVPGL